MSSIIPKFNKFIQKYQQSEGQWYRDGDTIKYILWRHEVFYLSKKKRIIYCTRDAFEKLRLIYEIPQQYKSGDFKINPIPKELEAITTSFEYYTRIVNETDSKESAQFGQHLEWQIVMNIGNECIKHGNNLADMQQTRIALKTFKYATNALTNWYQTNDNVNKLDATQQYKTNLRISILFDSIASIYGSMSNLDKSLMYCKESLRYFELERTNERKNDILKSVEDIKKFNHKKHQNEYGQK